MEDPRRAEPGRLTRRYVYRKPRAPMPPVRKVAIVLFAATGAVVLFGGATALAGSMSEPGRAVANGLAVLFLVGGICCWVAGGR